MAIRQDPDVWRSASHRLMARNLTGPFQDGARDLPITIDSAGRISVDAFRQPLLVAAPRVSLNDEAWRLDAAQLNSDGTVTPLSPLHYRSYTELGAFLPLLLPEISISGMGSTVDIQLGLVRIGSDDVETIVDPGEISSLVEIRVISGIIGRLAFLIGAEKYVIRRHAREIVSLRELPRARDNALDRMGAEIGVPRFEDQIGVRNGEIITEIQHESDPDYRRRLELYRNFLIPNKTNLLHLLNGPGNPADKNAGALGELGFKQRVQLNEEDNDFAFAVHLVEAGDQGVRVKFLDYIRRQFLILPSSTPANNSIHKLRYLPSLTLKRIQALRKRLVRGFDFAPDAAIAPMLAHAMDRVSRCRMALGVASKLAVTRAQDSSVGSRYELGLGLDIKPPDTVQLKQIMERVSDGVRRGRVDPETEGLLQSMVPVVPDQDPQGSWFFEACGLRTVHRVNKETLYLSHLPTFGLAIEGSSKVAVQEQTTLQARFHAPGDPGKNVVVENGLVAALEIWKSEGRPEWTAMKDAEAIVRWNAANNLPANSPALEIFRAAGMPGIRQQKPLVARLNKLPDELLATIRLDAALAQAIIAGQTGSIADLQRLLKILSKTGMTSALPLITGPAEVLIVVSVIGLPEVGNILSDRRATGFRWYAVPIQGNAGEINTLGSRTTYMASEIGLTAIVTVGYARRGDTDPFEFRVELPETAKMNIRQYEFLMNLLDHVHPAGVEVNTFEIRQNHVDLDEDGNAEPLPPHVFRTYRQFRRNRHRGEASTRIEQS